MKRFLAALLTVGGVALAQEEITIAMIPKLVGIDYFNATQQGAQEAAQELGVRLIYQGPTEARADRQVELIENFITAQVDVISVAANDPEALAPALQRAMDAGITVITWDADANARDIFVNQATAQGIGEALLESMVDQIGPDGQAAIITSDLTAPNQNAWIAAMEAKIASDYPEFRIIDTRAPGEDQQRAFQATQDVLNANPEVEGIFALSSVAFPGAADAVAQAGRSGEVAVVGLSTPTQMRPFVENGTVRDVILWNPIDLGYLSVYAAVAAATGEVAAGDTIDAGRLGSYTVTEDDISLQILLGDPFIFDASNIADFNF
ncbi:substrate-binding domain-containing protein [Truepera radiovictrix]|uniref:Autoinducer 2-binding protein LsrB n=1 Tax=Truepera radiovictrix (strain DSM 17093 / CIP 108686 / LMG 22925 / RQ-24) TaxID=649638 RepID=D7CW02_TRURR|nr:substrate-binding domain-containing protein [Truepera radiovictrix]ADI14265.1 putative secreted solute-binding lipoprotein [Truepera radiovictrix DSM 17093]WMT57177.1 substrate-binding domain-containing protein [Truepera radiovictrix]